MGLYFKFKTNRLKEINSSFEGNITLENETTHKNYYLSNDIKYMKHSLSVIKYIRYDKISKTNKTFRYITNVKCDNETIKGIVFIRRRRWKIENKGNYTQKNLTFDITHMCSMNDTAMKNHYLFKLLILLDNYLKKVKLRDYS